MAGSVVFTDTGNHVVRYVDPLGAIGTLAGNGASACGGDVGAPLLASFANIHGVSVDGSNTIYVADNGCAVVRAVYPCGPTHTPSQTLTPSLTLTPSQTLTPSGTPTQTLTASKTYTPTQTETSICIFVTCTYTNTKTSTATATQTSTPRIPVGSRAYIVGNVIHIARVNSEIYDVATIYFRLTRPEKVKVEIYSRTGHLVTVLADDIYPSTHNKVTWKGLNGDGLPVAPGVYTVLISASSFKEKQRIVVTK
jgi:hypothetical protein